MRQPMGNYYAHFYELSQVFDKERCPDKPGERKQELKKRGNILQ